MKAHRLERVAEVVREVASETILFEVNDPRVRGVTVTRAEVSGDLQRAKVYVSVMGSAKEEELCMHGLRHAAGFVQRRLGSRLKTRFTPTITFILDKGVKHSIEMTRLINEALATTPPTPPSQGGESEFSPPLEGGAPDFSPPLEGGAGGVDTAQPTAEEAEDQGSTREES